ncbi:hypothetical protein D1AOALGA4SA_3192 [Olavius algarvensis Delta 1 endosymbiont]|nr:hypothetical protein D1AOALGA4SA_3192 [Olavius algarvensis Delta 1 endosymbiont]
MKISAKLRTGYIFSAAIVIFAGIFIYISFKEMLIKNRELKYVDTISHNVVELNILANEYLIYREKRPKTQWDIVIDILRRLLGEAAIQASSHQSSLKEIREDIEIVRTHFSDLVSLHPRSKEMDTDELLLQTQNRIQGLMILKLQRVLSNTAQLKNQIGDELIHIQQFMSWMSITLIMVTALMSIVIGIIVSRSITSPIKHLMRRAESIGSGNLEDPLESTDWKDEIGNLSSSFDQMVINLKSLRINLKLIRINYKIVGPTF